MGSEKRSRRLGRQILVYLAVVTIGCTSRWFLYIPGGISRFAIMGSSISDQFTITSGLTDIDGPTTTAGSNTNNTTGQKRIRYQTIKDLPFQNTFATYQCKENEFVRKWGTRASYPPALAETGVFDFSTRIQSSLRFLVIGDSLGLQISQALEEALQVDASTRVDLHPDRKRNYARFVSFSPDGGIVAFWFVTIFLSGVDAQTKKNVDLLVNASRTNAEVAAIPTASSSMSLPDVDVVDVVILRIPVGWFMPNEVTREKVARLTELAFTLTNCALVIISTVPHANTLKTDERVTDNDQANAIIREFAASYEPQATTTAAGSRRRKQVFLVDFERLTADTTAANGAFLGIPENETLTWRLSDMWVATVAQKCSNLVPPGTPSCLPNLFSVDGMHWCPNTMAGRMNAAIACLTGCRYNDNDNAENANEGNTNAQKQKERQCAAECNDRYMSLQKLRYDVV